MRPLYAIPLILVAALGCRKSPPPAAMGPSPAATAPSQDGAIKGTLLERLDVPNYSYLRIRSGAQEVWAAVPTSTVEKGTEVTVLNPMPMKAFESKALNRTFDLVYFGTLAGTNAAPAMTGGAMPNPMTAQPQVDLGSQKIEKASGSEARTIAELYAQKEALKGKPVLIRGKVVKYNPNILGKNWVHLRDGSGNLQKGDNDITVTSADTTTLGEVVTARGTVQLDKDFGSGYSYKVILENTKLTK